MAILACLGRRPAPLPARYGRLVFSVSHDGLVAVRRLVAAERAVQLMRCAPAAQGWFSVQVVAPRQVLAELAARLGRGSEHG